MLKDEDHHWTPAHHLQYLESSGFTITQKMLQYVKNVEKELDDISDWRYINPKNARERILTQPALRKINAPFANIVAKVIQEKKHLAHMCEKKRRHLQKDEKRVRFGHYAFQRFYKLSAGAKKEKTYEDFCNSSTTMLLQFGLIAIMCAYSERYIDYVCQQAE